MSKNKSLSYAFAVTIFLSAFLLFLVQPLISKIILPWFGGSTGVWATCLVFFQTMLCLGYAYAHFIQRLPIRTQRWCHWGLLAFGLVCLPVMPGEAWKPLDGNAPAYKIFVILLLKTGLPYLALSATGPLLQAWYARIFPEARIYRLYALSNIASLSSLLLFPLWFERTMTLSGLNVFWSASFVVFVLCCGFVAYQVSINRSIDMYSISRSASDLQPTETTQLAPLPRHYLLWLALPAFASFLLLAGTNHLCQDIASTPFLWILPLCLYLLSFILCFDAPRWYVRRFYVVMGLVGLYGVIAMRELDDSELLSQGWLANGIIPFTAPLLQAAGWYKPFTSGTATWVAWLESQGQRSTLEINLVGQIFMHCVALFAVFMLCHGELARRKPTAKYLTAFYLMISIGGAIGSALVSLVAPMIFPGIWEWLFGVMLSVTFLCGLLFHWKYRDDDSAGYRKRFFYFAIPVLVVSGIVLWQSSNLPCDIARRFQDNSLGDAMTEFDMDASEAEVSAPIAKVVGTDFLSSMRRNWDYLHPLPSWVAIVGGISILTIVFLGLWAWIGKTHFVNVLRWSVINSVALIFIGFYLHDIFLFAPEDLFKTPEEKNAYTETERDVWRGRNFYGALLIKQRNDPNYPEQDRRSLQHGRIVHGAQFLNGAAAAQHTTYYSKSSGVGIAIDHIAQRKTVRMGAIGLGTGSLASYAAPRSANVSTSNDEAEPFHNYELAIYEINPLVVRLSEGDDPWFTYLRDARERGAKVDIVLGDARLMLEREESKQFDMLAIDAFSGDSIPIHLLTDEAMKVYNHHLRSDGLGVLAIHISNRYLDLEPICKGLATKYGYHARAVEADGNTDDDTYTSTWVLLTKDDSFSQQLDDTAENARRLSVKAGILWTDAYSSLYELLLNPTQDDAIEVITASHWYQKFSTTRSEIDLKPVSKWWGDGWTYFQTWPNSDDPSANNQLRVKNGRLELFRKTWEAVE